MPVTQLHFIKEFAKSPMSVGAIAPSSRLLAKSICQWIDWPNVRACCEFGPGTGAFTRQILACLNEDAQFFAIERNEKFARRLIRKFHGLSVYIDDVANIQHCLQREGLTEVQAIISGLPWAAFGDELQTKLLQAAVDALPPGGQFATFAYLQGLVFPSGIRFRRKLQQMFSSVERSRIQWLNFPPAIVYRCRK